VVHAHGGRGQSHHNRRYLSPFGLPARVPQWQDSGGLATGLWRARIAPSWPILLTLLILPATE
jgi:hypothetical protein